MLRRAEIGMSVACTSGAAAFDLGPVIDIGITAAGIRAEPRFAARVGSRLDFDHPGVTVRLTRRRVVEC